jgi:hypothetical protein
MTMLTKSQREANLHPSRFVILANSPLSSPLQPVEHSDPNAKIPQPPTAAGVEALPDPSPFLREHK